MHNAGNYIVSLGNVCRWLGQQAEALGVEIYPGFPAAELLVEDGRIVGIATGDMGIGKDGKPTANFQRGMELRARYTLFAEGCRGSLSQAADPTASICATAMIRRPTRSASRSCGRSPPPTTARAWSSTRSAGRSNASTYGGSFLYHFGDNLISYGFVIGLDYRNPWLSPFDEMQRFKTHPEMRKHFEGGRRISYGARALNEGGLQSIPSLTFPGGALIGDAAGFVNVPKIKGTHTSMKSGMLAAEAVAEALAAGGPASSRAIETGCGRAGSGTNCRWSATSARHSPSSACGAAWPIPRSTHTCCAARRRGPSTIRIPTTRHCWRPSAAPRIDYPRPDGVLTFDRLSSVFISNTNHEENQPAHLRLRRSRSGDHAELAAVPQPGGALLPGRRLRDRRRRRGQPATADQRAELRALQDLRHQGPGAEHRLGDAGRWRRAELSGRDVATVHCATVWPSNLHDSHGHMK